MPRASEPSPPAATADFSVLTDRQAEVVDAFAHRLPIKTIAADLGIAPTTVSEHLDKAKRKLGVRDNRELIKAYIEQKTVDAQRPNFGGVVNERVPQRGDSDQETPQDTPSFLLNDAVSPLPFEAWTTAKKEPVVVPEELDGEHAVTLRLVAIGKIVALILASVVLGTTALLSIETVVDAMIPASDP